jgi:hypothetical protein
MNILRSRVSTEKYFFRPRSKYVFSLFQERDKDLYYKFKENIVGGPSIIFHRYHEKDKTHIRGGKLCKRIWGADANALYLYHNQCHATARV